MAIILQRFNDAITATDDEWGCRVTLSRFTNRPQSVIYDALHTCHDKFDMTGMTEKKAGEIVIDRLLSGHKGHWSCLEFASAVFGVQGYSSSTIAQARTHRHLSFAVRSYRLPLPKVTKKNTEDYCLYRKPGNHKSRDGVYQSTEEEYAAISMHLAQVLDLYWNRIDSGLPPEHAREILPSCIRQDMQVSGNLRAFLHFLDLRSKANAQNEISHMSECIYKLLYWWCPEIMAWYTEHRYQKGKLAP